MIAIIYNHGNENYTALVDGYLEKIEDLNKLSPDKIWVTNTRQEDITRNNIKNISFFGTTFGEIINHFGYNNLNTFKKLTIVQKTVSKIVKKVELEHKVILTVKKIEGMQNLIVDFHKIKMQPLDDLIEQEGLECTLGDINIDLSAPKTKNYNISYLSRYAILNKIKNAQIPMGAFTTIKNNRQPTPNSFNIHICNIKLKSNLKDIRKALIFKDLIGDNKLVTDREISIISNICDIDIKKTYSYPHTKQFDVGVELNNPQDNFAEELYSGLMINKIKSISPILNLHFKKLEREIIYNDFSLIDEYDCIRVISISNNRFIIERNLDHDLNLNKIKSVINLNISLITKT